MLAIVEEPWNFGWSPSGFFARLGELVLRDGLGIDTRQSCFRWVSGKSLRTARKFGPLGSTKAHASPSGGCSRGALLTCQAPRQAALCILYHDFSFQTFQRTFHSFVHSRSVILDFLPVRLLFFLGALWLSWHLVGSGHTGIWLDPIVGKFQFTSLGHGSAPIGISWWK